MGHPQSADRSISSSHSASGQQESVNHPDRAMYMALAGNIQLYLIVTIILMSLTVVLAIIRLLRKRA
jgi:hypothetical protein